ncbi:MAG: hypothetical protein ABSG86_17710 [Thermoguttaceae bacterium]
MTVISRQREKCDRLPYTARLETGDCATCSARAAWAAKAARRRPQALQCDPNHGKAV